MSRQERLFLLCCSALLFGGAAVFLWGGSQHPSAGTEFGPLGSEGYFLNFARHAAGHPAWRAIHSGILAGPVLWALGASGVAMVLRRRGSCFPDLGLISLAMGGAAWAVTFVFDGFVAPQQAAAVVAGAAGAVDAFSANQEVVIRLGLVAWLLIGVGVAALGAAIFLLPQAGAAGRWGLGATGILLGLWPIAATLSGTFQPGPFTSPWWIHTAIATALWFAALGVSLALPALRRDNEGSVGRHQQIERTPAAPE